MIEERAVILSIEATPPNQDSLATIEVVRKTACGLCGQTRGCGNSIWGKLFGHKSTAFKAQNAINAQVGDHVIVGLEEAALIKSALALYIAPLVSMLFGAWLTKTLYLSDEATIAGAITGLLFGLLWVKGHTQGNAYYRHHQPRILRLDSPQSNPQNQVHPIQFH